MNRVILVVADPGDRGATAAATTALAGPGSSYVVSTRDLLASTWRHEVTRAGAASTRIELPGGAHLADADIGAVLFRGDLTAASSCGGDGAYAEAEWTALLVSWLAGLGDRVVNRVEGGSAVGPAWSPRRWLLAAAQAGLSVGPGGGTGVERTVLVAGDAVGDATDDAALLRLARRTGCRLLGVSLDADGFVVGVTPVPALHDPAHIGATARMLARVAATDPEEAA